MRKGTCSWFVSSIEQFSHTCVQISVTNRTHDSSWLLQRNVTCTAQNGEEFPDPSRLAYNDYFSFGHGKYNLDKPVFARLPGNKWALHDLRTLFKGNTLEEPLEGAQFL